MGDLKKQAAIALISALTGVVGTFVFVWRDMAVLKAEMAHLRDDVRLIQTFIATDDPQRWMAARAKLKADDAEHQRSDAPR